MLHTFYWLLPLKCIWPCDSAKATAPLTVTDLIDSWVSFIFFERDVHFLRQGHIDSLRDSWIWEEECNLCWMLIGKWQGTPQYVVEMCPVSAKRERESTIFDDFTKKSREGVNNTWTFTSGTHLAMCYELGISENAGCTLPGTVYFCRALFGLPWPADRKQRSLWRMLTIKETINPPSRSG